MENRVKRIVSGIIDFYIICILSTVLTALVSLGSLEVSALTVITYFGSFFLMVVFKDLLFNGSSLGKKVFKLRVVKEDGTKLNFVDVLKRSVTLVFTPVEDVLILVNGKRLGDMWANTQVIGQSLDFGSR